MIACFSILKPYFRLHLPILMSKHRRNQEAGKEEAKSSLGLMEMRSYGF